MAGEVGKAGTGNLAGYPVKESTETYGPFKAEDKVCGSLGTEHYVTMKNTKLDDGAFSFEMSIDPLQNFNLVNIRQKPSGDVTGLSVIAPGKQYTEVYRGPAVYDDLQNYSSRLSRERRVWGDEAHAGPSSISVVGNRPAEGELGTVTREGRPGGHLTATFTKAEGSDARRLDALLTSSKSVLQAGTKRDCQSAYDMVETMGFLTPGKPDTRWK